MFRNQSISYFSHRRNFIFNPGTSVLPRYLSQFNEFLYSLNLKHRALKNISVSKRKRGSNLLFEKVSPHLNEPSRYQWDDVRGALAISDYWWPSTRLYTDTFWGCSF